MNELQVKVFENTDFGQMRVIEKDEEPWFALVDACRELDIKDTNKASNRLEEDELTRIKIGSGGQTRELLFVNEPGLYSLILGSRKPDAKKFKRWITHDVIPSIRKTGLYATDQAIDQILNDPDFGIRLLQELKQSRKEAMEAQKQIAESKPKIEFYDKVLQSENLMTTTEIAKDFGWSAHKLNKFLEEKKVQYRQSGRYLLYADYSDRGLAQSRTFVHTNREGEEVTDIYLCWTQKGREIIYNLLKSEGVYPEAHKVANQ